MSSLTGPDFWVSLVVLGFRQASFLSACLQSLEVHGLEGVQVILVDNGSSDGSAELMQDWAKAHPGTELQLHRENLGHTKAINRAMGLVKAPYMLDMSADDELPAGSLRLRVDALEAMPEAAFCHGNALYIDEKGRPIGYEHPPASSDAYWQGDVWQRLFEGRFICPSSVLFRVEALRVAGGYDEALSYEDFDIWMRLTRDRPIAYVPDVVSRHRLHPSSASAQHTRSRNRAMLDSTLIICQKALQLSRTPEERAAIVRFASYHLRLAAYTGHPVWVRRYAHWLSETEVPTPLTWFWNIISQLPLQSIYGWYSRRRQRANLIPVQ